MGNSQSDIKSRFSLYSLPKHLRPLGTKKLNKLKKLNKEYCASQNPTRQESQKTVHYFGCPAKQEEPGPSGAFLWLKGRRFFNKTSPSLLPNDQLELDRARVQAYILRWAFGGVSAPVELEKGKTVLNVGHGPGMWPGHHMIDLALDYRDSYFVAVDVYDLLPDDFEQEQERLEAGDEVEERTCCHPFTPVHPHLSVQLQTMATPPMDPSASSFSQSTHSDTVLEEESLGQERPTKRTLLKNLDFYRHNAVEERLPFADNQFDFVKQRLSVASLTLESWQHVLIDLLRVTKPGGWIGLMEVDFYTTNLGPVGRQFELQMIKVAQSQGMEPQMAPHLRELLQALGLEDIRPQSVSIPLGEWGMDLGMLWKNNLESFADSVEPFMCQLLNLTNEQYKEKWRIYFEEGKETKPFSNVYVAWGRKPLEAQPPVDWSLCSVFNKRTPT
ncbi:hypothetical protein BY458DRAFT_499343 [Sporodiniella umbellata]|nr:hypothetical protein BY458DRAFT_499343 [Sporodiniella umbellata]